MISTAISDGVLCACALLAARIAWPRGWAVAGLLLLALAAGVGVLRYSIQPELAGWHRAISFLAGTLGLPAVLMGYLRARWLAVAVLGSLAALSVVFWLQPPVRLAVGLGGLLAWSWQAWRAEGSRRAAIATGIAASLVAAAFARPGDLLGMPHVDWLHYVLAIAVIAFATACNPWRPRPTPVSPAVKTAAEAAPMIPRHG